MGKNKWLILAVIIIIIIALFCFVWIKMSTYNNDVSAKIKISLFHNEIEINEENKGSQEQNIDLTEFSFENDTVLKYEANRDIKLYVNGKQVNEKEEINLGKQEISKENNIEIKIKYNFYDTRTYNLKTYPETFPKYEFEGKSNYDGDYYLTTYNVKSKPYYLLKIDEEGKTLYYKKTSNMTFDFKKYSTNNGIRYTYLEKIPSFTQTPTSIPSKLVIMDENYNLLKEVIYEDSDKKIALDNHNQLYISDNSYILSAIEKIETDNIPKSIEVPENGVAKVTQDKIKEIKNGEVIWEFRTSDYPELYEYSTVINLKNELYSEYAHFNSMCIDPSDNNLICSFRNLDALIKIDRTNGKLIWVLGGKAEQFQLTEEQKFAKQHSVNMLDNGRILLFNNNNIGEQSSIIMFIINEENKIIENYNRYELEGIQSASMGSVVEANSQDNVYTICYGMATGNDYEIEEKNLTTGETYFKFKFLDYPYQYNVNKIS